MKNVISLLLTLLTLSLALPASLILASWNALPGDRMYPVKLKLERVAVRLTGETTLARELEVKYIKRRFSEANKLLAKKHSTIGFTLVTAQAKTAKEKVIQAQDTQTKEILVTNLIEFNQRLDEKKAEIKTQTPTSPPATAFSATPPSKVDHPLNNTPTPKKTAASYFPIPTPTEAIKVVKSTPTPTSISAPQPEADLRPGNIPSPTPQEPEKIIKDIEETQEEIKAIIEELEEEIPTPSGPSERIQQIMEERQRRIEEIRGRGRGKD